MAHVTVDVAKDAVRTPWGHHEAYCEWQLTPVARPEIRGHWLKQTSGSCLLEKAIDDDDDDDGSGSKDADDRGDAENAEGNEGCKEEDEEPNNLELGRGDGRYEGMERIPKKDDESSGGRHQLHTKDDRRVVTRLAAERVVRDVCVREETWRCVHTFC